MTALEDAALIPDTTYFNEIVPIAAPASARRANRPAWFERLKQSLEQCDLIFLDPDNGLEPNAFSHGAAKAGKCVGLAELKELQKPGRALIVYHHQTRRPGGHHEEIGFWSDRLRDLGFSPVDALRSKPFSARAFFILGGDEVLRQRAHAFSERWQGLIRWYPDSSRDAEQAA